MNENENNLTVNEIGVDIEDENTQWEHPFNPKDIDINTTTDTINNVIDAISCNEIRLAPDFQRKDGLWSQKQKSLLIESILLGIPLPMFYVSSDREGHYDVIDGIQRLSTLRDFILGKSDDKHPTERKKFALKDMEFLTHLNDKTFDQLPRQHQRDINRTNIQLTVIKSGTPEEVKYNIFKRINTGGLPLSAQEIRHALHQGKATKFLAELSKNDYFLTASRNSVKDDRMEARELILRLLAFFIRNYSSYTVKGLDKFLSDTMIILNEIGDTPERLAKDFIMPEYNRITIKELSILFEKAMKRGAELFGKEAFRTSLPGASRSTRINKALFESWGYSLAVLSDSDWNKLSKRKDILINNYRKLWDVSNPDEFFQSSISQTASDPKSVQYRFNIIKKLISEVLG